ncbi:MAG: hypothetical protein M1815_003369 [Lichina confinis]|nr:MAG: hypothetical protein M1815_003369 [Lichina confinis]
MTYQPISYQDWLNRLNEPRPASPPYPGNSQWQNPAPGNGHIWGIDRDGEPSSPEPSSSAVADGSSSSSSTSTASGGSATPTSTVDDVAAAGGLATATGTPTASSTTTTVAAATSSSAVPQATPATGFLGTEGQAANTTTSSGMARGTIFAAIFIPIASVAFICSLCLVCFLRRRRRMKRHTARGLQTMRQGSVEFLSPAGFSSRQSRAMDPTGDHAKANRFSTSSKTSAIRHGPLITVDGPSYSRPREEPPPPYKNGSPTGGPSASRGSPRPARPDSDQFSSGRMSPSIEHERSPFADPEPHIALYRLPHPSPFDDRREDDGNVSDLSSPGGAGAGVRRNATTRSKFNRDTDAVSVVSFLSDTGPTRSASQMNKNSSGGGNGINMIDNDNNGLGELGPDPYGPLPPPPPGPSQQSQQPRHPGL